MSCAGWKEKLALFSGGDMTPEEIAGVEAHLSGCAACREAEQELSEARLMLFSLRTVAEDELAAVRSDVMRQVASRRRRPVLALLPYAALIAMLSFGWIGTRQPIEPPEPPRINAAIPQVVQAKPVSRPKSRERKRAVTPKQETVVTLFTEDPDVVIVWISD